jgi:hypothetical protein
MTFKRRICVGFHIPADSFSRGGSALPGGIREQRFRRKNDRKGNGRVDPRTEKTFPIEEEGYERGGRNEALEPDEGVCRFGRDRACRLVGYDRNRIREYLQELQWTSVL